MLRENLTAFERLLSHNRKARIVWSHCGWDNTGHRTVALMRRLLKDHANLYMSIKIDRLTSLAEHRPLNENREVRPEWLDLIRSFPDRFVIGSDQFYASAKVSRKWPLSSPGPRALLDQLPVDLARKVASENAARIYKLK